MPRTKHPYDETLTEKIERWAVLAVTEGDQSQQLALVSLLHAFSKAAGSQSDAFLLAIPTKRIGGAQ